MNGPADRPSDDGKIFRILSLDGGGYAACSSRASGSSREHLEHPIGRYFDLIAGTSTGGIIAIALGLGLPARDILKLYVEEGDHLLQQHGAVENWVRQKVRGMAHLLVTKHSSEPLRRALEGVLRRRTLGEAVPAGDSRWHPVLERIYSTRPRTIPAWRRTTNSRRSTRRWPPRPRPRSSSPMTESAVELLDGGVWANNPIGVAAIEAIGILAGLETSSGSSPLGRSTSPDSCPD